MKKSENENEIDLDKINKDIIAKSNSYKINDLTKAISGCDKQVEFIAVGCERFKIIDDKFVFKCYIKKTPVFSSQGSTINEEKWYPVHYTPEQIRKWQSQYYEIVEK